MVAGQSCDTRTPHCAGRGVRCPLTLLGDKRRRRKGGVNQQPEANSLPLTEAGHLMSRKDRLPLIINIPRLMRTRADEQEGSRWRGMDVGKQVANPAHSGAGMSGKKEARAPQAQQGPAGQIRLSAGDSGGWPPGFQNGGILAGNSGAGRRH